MDNTNVSIHLTDYQRNWVQTKEVEIKTDIAIYFSLILGVIVGYIAIKGLLSNWKA
jgi:hypothetical protein